MSRATFILIGTMLVAAAGIVVVWESWSSGDAGPAGTHHDPFFDEPPWHDGLAEVNLYDAVEVRYGTPRQANEATLIFVKEDHRAANYTKADDPAAADLPAVKLNWVVDVTTGMYTYRQMASVFVNRVTGRPFRQTFASHEWCGNTFKDVRYLPGGGGGYRYAFDSYFGDEASGMRQVAAPAGRVTLFADALPVHVRSLKYEAGATWPVAMLPALWSNRAWPQRFAVTEATVRIDAPEPIEVPAGRFDAWRITVTYADGKADVYHVGAAPARTLVKLQRADGAVYSLRRSFRTDYWKHNAPGDEWLVNEP